MNDARTNLPAVMAVGQQCVQMIQTNQGTNNDRGYRWQTGSPGLSLTNIIITPNSTISSSRVAGGIAPRAAASISAISTCPAAPTPAA